MSDATEKLQKEIKTLTAGVQGAKRDLEEKNKELDTVVRAIKAAESELEGIKRQINSTENTFISVQDALDTKNVDLQAATAREAELIKKIAAIETLHAEKTAALKAVRESFNVESHQYNEKLTKLKNAVEAAEAELEKSKRESADAQAQAQARLTELQSAIATAEEAVAAASTRQTEAKEAAQEAERALEGIMNKVTVATDKLTSVRGEITSAKQELQGIVEKQQGEQQKLDTLIEERKASEAERLRWQKRKEQLDAREAHIKEHYQKAGVTYLEIED